MKLPDWSLLKSELRLWSSPLISTLAADGPLGLTTSAGALIAPAIGTGPIPLGAKIVVLLLHFTTASQYSSWYAATIAPFFRSHARMTRQTPNRPRRAAACVFTSHTPLHGVCRHFPHAAQRTRRTADTPHSGVCLHISHAAQRRYVVSSLSTRRAAACSFAPHTVTLHSGVTLFLLFARVRRIAACRHFSHAAHCRVSALLTRRVFKVTCA